MTGPFAVRAVAQPEYVKRRARDLVAERRKNRGGAQVLVLRARPDWRGDPALSVEGATVHVRTGASQLAVLAAYEELHDALATGDFLVVLTDQEDRDLGDAVLLRASRRSGQPIDQWSVVPGLFHGARTVGQDLRRLGDWVPEALLAHAPPTGWPTSPGLELSADFALGNLLAHLLGRSLPETVDEHLVLDALGDRTTRGAWGAVGQELRERLIVWAERSLGPAVSLPLRIGASGRDLSPLVVALAADVLWPDSSVHRVLPEQAEARGRIERYTGGVRLDAGSVRLLAAAANAALLRLPPVQVNGTLRQAEQLLTDVGWANGAEGSEHLPAGLTARLRLLGRVVADGDIERAEILLVAAERHGQAMSRTREVLAARMAVRLGRWLATPESTVPSIQGALALQMNDGAWVDRALAHVWRGSDDPALGAAYGALASLVRERRRAQDRSVARHVTTPSAGTLLVEDVLASVVLPWAGHGGVLLVVLDGMSAAVATELAEAMESLAVEWVPHGGRRAAALAALPSLTAVSRCSLLAGKLVTGDAAVEAKLLPEAIAGSMVFHKEALRATSGNALTEPVAAALANSAVPVVATVINRIDDTLHKTDAHDETWTVDALRPLGELINAALLAGRGVVLTSDHGHVAERGTTARLVPESQQARVRPVASGPVAENEVLVSGARVMYDGGQAVLAVDDDLRYGPKQSGYHGGASLAEVTVPVLAFAASGVAGPDGWVRSTPQAPVWWNESELAASAAADEAVGRRPKPTARVEITLPSAEQPAFEMVEELFTVVRSAGATSSPDELVGELLASEVYAEQRKVASRAALSDQVIEAVVRSVLVRGGRAHRDTVAVDAGVSVAEVEPTIAAVKRVLNVDGYAVLSMEDGGSTVRLDESLLREQFGLGRA